MKPFRVVRSMLILALSIAASGCVTGRVLYMPGELARPGKERPDQKAAGGPVVAVTDFEYAGTPPYEIGRDFDHARAIVWKEDPGKAIPDLIAAVLHEKGMRTVRIPARGAIPAEAVARVWGKVDKFRVEARKAGSLRMTAQLSASLALTVFGSGGSAPPGWRSSVASEYTADDPVFITPDGIREVVNAAANAVAEETVRRLVSAGVIALPPNPAPGPPEGQPPSGAGN